MPTTVVAVFKNHSKAQAAIEHLIESGFQEDRISMVAADPDGHLYRQMSDQSATLTGPGAAAGLTSGAFAGGALGLLIGAGLLFVPAGIVAAGAISGLITGGVVGAATGGVIGGLIGLGIPADHADAYAESVRGGGTLVTVQADDDRARVAHEILDRDGAVDMDARAVSYRNREMFTHGEESQSLNEDDVRAERERNALAVGAVDEAELKRIHDFESGPGTGSGAYADNPLRKSE